MQEPVWLWVLVFGSVLALLATDQTVFARHRRGVPMREAVLLSVLWVVVAGIFGLGVLVLGGAGQAEEYFTAYIVEKGFAIDIVFAIALVFASLAVPRSYQHRVLFDVWGVTVALSSRVIFILAGLAFIDHVSWSVYLLGGILLIVGLRLLRQPAAHPLRNVSVRILRRFLPVTPEFHGPAYLVRLDGRLFATPMLVAAVAVETAEIVLSFDSVPAVLGVTDTAFLVFSATAFSILGLRSLYIVLADAVPRYRYLRLGVSAMVLLVGLKLVLSHVVHVPIWLSLAVAGSLMVASLTASALFPPGTGEVVADNRRAL